MTNPPWDNRFEELLRRAVPLLAEGSIDPAQDLRDAGLHSMGSVELLLQLESTYEVLVPDEATVAGVQCHELLVQLGAHRVSRPS